MNGGIGRVTEAQVRRELLREADQTARRRIRAWAVALLIAALLAGAVTARFLMMLACVRTSAMEGVLLSGDVVLCERADSPIRKHVPARGDLALIRYQDNGMNREAVRRIIALPGDVISVDADGSVTLNDAPLEEPYASWRTVAEPAENEPGGAIENPFVDPESERPATVARPVEEEVEYPLTVSPGYLFVLSDDREDALDSRSVRFGLVREEDVLGWPRIVVWPAHRAATRVNEG